MLFTMASVALPGTSGFVGEFLALTGMFLANSWLALLMTSGIILGAAYMLWLYARVAFGDIRSEEVAAMPDVRPREVAVLLPMALVVIWMGVAPGAIMEPLRAPVASLVARVERASPPATPVTMPVVEAAREQSGPA
jgi:NADH-quinone oxidoreductase subunit M